MNIDTLLPWAGKQITATEEVTAIAARRIEALLDRPRSDWTPGTRLPSHWYVTLFGETVRQSELGIDGHPGKGDFLPPVPLPRRMFAGRRVRFEHPLHIGDTLFKTSTVKSITPKTGKSGEMCFVTVCHEIFGAQGRAIYEEQDIVYRAQSAPGSAPVANSPKANATLPETDNRDDCIANRHLVTPDEVMLFRYSAITFNGHRIHYDRDYARNVEGYPDLVVNGGLTLLLMWEHAIAQGVALRYSASRNLKPLFVRQPIALECQERAGARSIRAFNPEGNLAVEANLTEAQQ